MAQDIQFKDAASGQLSAAISNTATTLVLGAGQGTSFPVLTGTQYFKAALENQAQTVREEVKVTATSGDTMTIQRGIDGYTAQSWPAGSTFELRVTSAELTDMAKQSEPNTFSALQTFNAGTSGILPAGEIKMWPTATAPTGYLNCAGAAVSRTTYAALFAVIGVTFGTGDGSTTFNLPNYVDRMPIGAGTIANIAGTGGAKDAVVVSHTHTATVSDPGHQHANNTSSQFLTSGGGPGGTNSNGGVQVAGLTTSSATTGISVANTATGVSGTNANLPPYLGINFIIKT